MLYLKCKGQVMSVDVDERIADQYINANTVHFEFCERWNGMTITAQFTQDGKTYNKLVDEVTSTVILPNEIMAGKVEISAFGVHPVTGVRITTIPVKKTIDKSGFVGDGELSIPPTPDLYAQLLEKVNKTAIPHIGANGNWWFDDWDSGVAATAEVDAARQAAVNEINRAAANQMVEMDNKFANTMKDIPEAYTDLDADVKSLKDTKAPAIECEASGSIITVDDAAALPVHGLVSQIVPVQAAGTPTLEKPLPISGRNTALIQRAGKNLISVNYNGTTAGINIVAADNVVTMNGEDTSTSPRTVDLATNIKLKAGTYTFSVRIIGGSVSGWTDNSTMFRIYKGTGNTMLAAVKYGGTHVDDFTLSEDTIVRLCFLRPGYAVTFDNTQFAIQLECGSEATEFEPPNIQTITANLPETVYGGTLDWKTGVLTSDCVLRTFDGTEAWGTVGGSAADYFYLKLGVIDTVVRSDESAYTKYSHFVEASTISTGNTNTGAKVVNSTAYNQSRIIVRPDPSFISTKDEWITYLAEQANPTDGSAPTPFQVCYQLQQPTTIQLTPQQMDMLKGCNNVWSDCGDTSLVYVADTKMYIDKRISELVTLALANQ